MSDKAISISDSSDDERTTGQQQKQTTQVKKNVAVKRTSTQTSAQPTASCSNAYNNSKQRGRDKEAAEFLNGFDPDHSRRELNKRNIFLAKAPQPRNTKKNNTSLFDEHGRYRATLEDVCDCLTPNCKGCHFPCDVCRSTKCGTKCRQNRKFAFEKIEYDGKQDTSKENAVLKRIKIMGQ